MFCCTLLNVHSSIAIILMGKRELVALLNLFTWCLVMVERLFLAVPQGCLLFVIVVFPDHTHLLILLFAHTTLLEIPCHGSVMGNYDSGIMLVFIYNGSPGVSLDIANINIKFEWNINFTTLTAANIFGAFVVIILYFTPLQIVLNAIHEKKIGCSIHFSNILYVKGVSDDKLNMCH